MDTISESDLKEAIEYILKKKREEELQARIAQAFSPPRYYYYEEDEKEILQRQLELEQYGTDSAEQDDPFDPYSPGYCPTPTLIYCPEVKEYVIETDVEYVEEERKERVPEPIEEVMEEVKEPRAKMDCFIFILFVLFVIFLFKV